MIKVGINASSRYAIDRKSLRRLVREFLKSQGVEGDAEVGICVVGERKMKQLNKEHAGVNRTTDVLSFSQLTEDQKKPEVDFVEPMNERLYLGDLVICFPVALQQAMEKQVTVDEEIEFLAQHGLLHLLGIHHD